MKVTPRAVPTDALLQRYVVRAGAYTDCFEVTLPGKVALPNLITAFYTTWLFGLERAVLTVVLRRRIRDADVLALAAGTADRFAAWRVEDRREDQILLCDIMGSTRSFLAVTDVAGGGTRVLFGSAVMPRGQGGLGLVMKILTPLHRIYAKALLQAACRKLR